MKKDVVKHHFVNYSAKLYWFLEVCLEDLSNIHIFALTK